MTGECCNHKEGLSAKLRRKALVQPKISLAGKGLEYGAGGVD